MSLQKALLTVAIISGLFMSCVNNSEKNKDGFSTITGTFYIPKNKDIYLMKVEHGKATPIATTKVNKKQQFGFALKPDKEGFYILASDKIEIPLYIKGNQQFKIDYDRGVYRLKDIPDTENEVLYNWYQSNDTLNSFDSFSKRNTTYKDFFPFYEKFIPQMKKQHDYVNTQNQQFNKLMHAYIDLNIEMQALKYVFSPRSEHPETKDMPSYYQDFMKGDNFKTTIILDLPQGLKIQRLHQMFKAMHDNNNVKPKNYISWMVNTIENDTLKGYMALANAKKFKSYDEEYLAYIEPLKKYTLLSDYVSKNLDEHESGIKKALPGLPGYEFTYKDIEGKNVSFSDFRGKIVYIDAWATWCGPCRAEIPSLKKLEKEFHGKDIVFVSISLDKSKDTEKWKRFVREKELTGIQLISDDAFNTSLARDYKINSIPRFLLFDKEGKIVDANAKRPSNADLRSQLKGLLQ